MEHRVLLASAYRHILAPEDKERLPAYAALTLALAESNSALELLAAAEEHQQNPTLILAILHLAALRGDETLSPLYSALDEGKFVEPDRFAATVVHYLEGHVDELKTELWRATQTNEVNRSAVLATVIGDVAHQLRHDRITLVDVGCSMGLNLFPDKVRVADQEDGDPATLITTCLSGDFTRQPVPTITHRVGIDLNLLSASSPDDVLWLRACLWPEERRRVQRFEAILHSLPDWPQPEFRGGDAIKQVRRLLTEPGSEPMYLLNSWVLAYFTDDERRAWRAMIDEFLPVRPIVWISFEHPWVGLSLNFPAVPGEPPRKGATQVVVTASTEDSRHWGWCHPHGHWFSVGAGPKA